MTGSFSSEDIAKEARTSGELVDWLASIRILKPREPDTYRYGDVYRTKLVAAMLEAGFTREQIERAAAAGQLNLDHIDQFYPEDPGPLSTRTFGEFMREAGPRASSLPAIFDLLGVPRPDLSSPIRVEDEDLLERFLAVWRLADDESLIRAALMVAEGTRRSALGWMELLNEKVGTPARERLYRGETEGFPQEVREAFVGLLQLAPRMMKWLTTHYLEQRSVQGLVEGFEEYLASKKLGPPPRAAVPPAIAFVDISGYTRLTEERGDHEAAGFATTLQRVAQATAAAHGGRLVKLLGDGAMLELPDAEVGVRTALDLVGALERDGVRAHAGVHAGPVIERDLDLFGRTVNLASRIAGVASPGEVLVSQAVADLTDDEAIRFEPKVSPPLKGVGDPVALFRATLG